MRITVLDCARGVKAIYKNQDFESFQLIQGFYDPKNSAVEISAYSLGVYKYLPNPDTYMISLRGSAKSFTTKDWIDDDVSIALGQTPDRTNDVALYTREVLKLYANCFIIMAGHSLGGHLAQYLGVTFNLPFITFNAPPALGTFTGKLPDGTRVGNFRVGNFRQGLNFRVNYDPVSRAPGKHVGPLVTLPLNGQKHLAAHTAKVVVESVIASGLGDHSAIGEITRRNQ
jgi:hypothetical protein